VTEALRIRPAEPEEAKALTDLALRSKAHWGYDADFLEACRDDLAVTPFEIETLSVHVAESGGRIAGFYVLDWEEPAELTFLFVDPDFIGAGVGRTLWDHVVANAQDLGLSELVVHSDPEAEPFYRAMGCERFAEIDSPVEPGRKLPLLRFAVPAIGTRGGR